MTFRIRDMRYGAGLTHGRHVHDELQISIILRGELREEVNGVAYRGVPGDVVIKPAAIPHSDSFDLTRIVCLDADPRLVDMVPPGYSWHRNPTVTAAAMRVAVRYVRSECTTEDVDELLAALSPARDRVVATKAARAIDEQFADNVSIDALAADLGVHRVYLARVFRERWGCSPREYVQRARLRAVANQLVTTTKPIVDIALGAGFSDQGHMSRVFARQLGTTPAAFRRLARA